MELEENMKYNIAAHGIHKENVRFMNYIITNDKFEYFDEENVHMLFGCLLQSTMQQMLMYETDEQVKLKVNAYLKTAMNGTEMSKS
tara:strand:+ start:4337 stop:4594 length:258 start_codon:yes stop_codon:yes gene_type:complete